MKHVPRRDGIGILMPLKNHHPDYLRMAMDSALTQTDPAWQLLVIVEPADANGFRDLLRRQLCAPRITLHVNEGRKLAGALNTGMRRAETEFVGILLSDDLWVPEAVAVLRDHIARFPAVDFFHSSRRIIDDRGAPLSSVHRSRESFTLDDFVKTSPVKHLLCWRRSKGISIGGLDESLNSVGPDDCDFPWCMAEQGATFKAIHECLYLYRDHRAAYRLTTHLPLRHHTRELRRILTKHGVPPAAIRRRLAEARRSYLRQCLYRSGIDRWLKQKVGWSEQRGYRERYR